MAKAHKRLAGAWTYVLVADRGLPVEQQSRFLLSPLTHAERAAVLDSLARLQSNPDGSRVTLSRTRVSAFEIARDHIVSVENFPSDKPQPWPSDTPSRAAYLDWLADDEVLELGNEVFARSDIGAKEEESIKNFSAPERTSSSGAPSPTATETPAPVTG